MQYLNLLINSKPSYWLFQFWFWITTIYLPASRSKFVSDYLQWVARYEDQGWTGIYQSFNDVSLKYGYHFLMYGGYKLFAWNNMAWQIFMCGIHSMNAVLLLILIKKLLALIDKKNTAIPIIAALLFLLSPFQTETVVWAASIHFLVTPTLIFSCLLLVLNYFPKLRWRHIFIISLLFTIGLYTTEAIIILPLLVILLIVIIGRISAQNNRQILLQILKISIPLFGIIIFFFLHTKFVFGNAVGHYGADTHLKLDLYYIVSNYLKYIAKFVFYLPQLNVDKNYFSQKLEGPKAFLGFIIFIIIFISLFVNAYLKNKKKWLLISFLIFSFFIALAPVINLENQSYNSVQTDRYSYIASTFFSALSAFLILFYAGKYKRYLIVAILILHIIGLVKNINTWHKNGLIFESLLENFPIDESGQDIYILSLPDSYKGAYLLRNGLLQGLQMNGKNIDELKIKTLGYINMLAPTDSVHVTQIQDTMHVIVSNWGRWFQFFGNGSKDSNVQFLPMQEAHEYKLIFKQDNPKIIYQSGDKWRIVQ